MELQWKYVSSGFDWKFTTGGGGVYGLWQFLAMHN